MGASGSKKRDSGPIEDPDHKYQYFVDLSSDAFVTNNEIEKLRKEYLNNPEMFLLNQMLFSVMFFQNYDQELAESVPNETISVKELSLTEDLFLTCLKPDDALSLVNRHVQFSASHGANKDKISPLVSNRIFVIHENIQIVADSENHYANIDRPSLTAQVVENQRKGYVRLKYIEDLKFKNSVSSNSSTLTNSSADDRSDTYGRITQARTIKPMPKMNPHKMNKTLYPITEVKRPNYQADKDDEDLYTHEYFVNSTAMKEQFHRNWPNVAILLELDDDEIKAGFNCDSIFCQSSAGEMWEIIPAVQLPKGAYGHFIKSKSDNIDKQLAKKKDKVFPTKAMLNKIVDMDRLAIARGFISKYRDEINPNRHLEWELAHPKVEKYLQQFLTHTHVRTLLLLVLILKTFVEPKTTNQGVTIRHLVIHLFWELQNNVVINETRMGTRLVKIINALVTKLGKSELKDYFVEERNHFENVPSHYIRYALEEFARTSDNPLPRFMTAIRNLRYTHDEFPELDVKELHRILTKSMALTWERKMEKRHTQFDWEAKQRERLKREKRQSVVENLKPKRKVSVDSILEEPIKDELTKNPDLLNPEQLTRNREVLLFFLQHYTKMATSLQQLGNSKQAMSYLRQGELLTYLFHKSCYEEASSNQEKIRKLRKLFEEEGDKRSICETEHRRKLSTPNGPTLPPNRRSSSVYIPQNRAINQNMTINQTKVLQQHQNGEVRSKVLRKRRESMSNPKSEDSDQDFGDFNNQGTLRNPPMIRKRRESEKSIKSDTSEKVRPRKTVNFNTEVMIAKGNLDVNMGNIVKQDAIDKHVNASVIITKRETSDSDTDNDVVSLSSGSEEKDLEGLDEIMSDDEIDSRQSIVQFTNPFDYQNNKVNLGYDPGDAVA